MRIKERPASQLHALGNADAGDAAAPSLDDFLRSHPVRELIEDLPHHNASSLKGRFAMADFRIGDDVLAEFEPAGKPLTGTLGVFHEQTLRAAAKTFKGIQIRSLFKGAGIAMSRT